MLGSDMVAIGEFGRPARVGAVTPFGDWLAGGGASDN